MKPNSYEKWKNSASSLADDWLASGEPGQARSLLERVLLVRPEEVECRVKLTRALLDTHELADFRNEGLFLSLLGRKTAPQQKLDLFSRLVEQFPEDTNLKVKAAELSAALKQTELTRSLYASLAENYIRKQLPMKAIAMYEKILELDPGEFSVLQKIAEIYVAEGIFDKAIRQYFELANRYLSRQMLQEAGTIFEQILSIDPVNQEACFPLARIYLLEGRLEQASKTMHRQIENCLNKGRVDEAASLSKEFVDLLLERNQIKQARSEREQMANALFQRGRKKEAVALFADAADGAVAEKDLPKFVKYMTLQIDFYTESDQPEKMSQAVQKMVLSLLALDKQQAKNHLEDFIQQLIKQNQIPPLDQALRQLAKALEERRNFEESEQILMRLGDVYGGLYRVSEAIRIYESIVHRGSENPVVYQRLADLYSQEENLSRARDLYIRSMELYILQNAPDEAEKIFKLAAKKDTKSPALLSKMGDVYYSMGEWDKALSFFQKALALDAFFRPAVVGTAMTYAKKGMLDEMVLLAKRLVAKGLIAEIVEEYRKALSLNSSPSECSIALGLLYKDLGFMDEAIIEFQNASRDPASFLKATNLLGLCFKAQNFPDLAIRQFRKALDNKDYEEEESLEIRYNLAVTYEEVNMKQGAYELYNDILVSDIGYKDVKSRLRNLGSVKGQGKVVSFGRGGEGKKT